MWKVGALRAQLLQVVEQYRLVGSTDNRLSIWKDGRLTCAIPYICVWQSPGDNAGISQVVCKHQV